MEPSPQQPSVRRRPLRHAHRLRPRRPRALVVLAIGVLSLGAASIGLTVRGAGPVRPDGWAPAAAAVVDPAPVSPAPPPAAQPWWPLSAVGAARSDVRSDRSCVASSAAAIDRRGSASRSAAATADPAGGALHRAVVSAARGVIIAAPRTRTVAAFLGDSYTTGYNGSGLGDAGWPAIVSAALRLRPLNRAVAGTGFVNPGWTAQPIWTRVAAVVGARPRVVFLAGGHNDRRFGSTAAGKAADGVIERLHRALPDTILVVIGPIWMNGDPPVSLRLLDQGLRRTATVVGAIFIDPLQGGWFAGSAGRLIGPDGIHPTNAGHRHIARLVLQRLNTDPRFRAMWSARSAAPMTATPVVASPEIPVAVPLAGCVS